MEDKGYGTRAYNNGIELLYVMGTVYGKAKEYDIDTN